jgi:hypothetical protein
MHCKDGHTALTLAATKGYTGIVRALMEAGVSVKTPPPGTIPPLMAAVCSGRGDIVRLMLDSGVNIKLGCDGLTPLGLARSRKDAKIESILLQAGAAK